MADKWRLRFQSEFRAGFQSFASPSSQDCDVLTTEDCSGSDDDDSKDPHKGGFPPHFSNYWTAVVQKPFDFTAWTKLVAYAEKERHLAACRTTYEAFLSCFPLAHIYWKKYADIEQHLGSAEESEKIFTHAVKLNPLNATLWTSYLLFLLKKVNLNLPESAVNLQRVFNEAIDACGMEFHSDDLWSLYIEYEIKHENLKDAMALYNRLLNIPTQRYQLHFDRFTVLASTHSPVEFLTLEELIEIHMKIQAENEGDQVAVEDVPAGEIRDSLTEKDVQKIQQHILDTRKQMYLLNKVQVEKRIVFEDGIKRLYFCAQPVSAKQLQNWRKYLKFEMSEGQHERIVLLYERCLMPCAMYEEFWLLYAQYMEGHSVEAARSVFERACRVYLPLKFTLHLQWALFEEKHGQLDSARAILCNLEKVLPGVVMVRLRLVNFERRNGNLEEAERLLREAVQKSSGSEMAAFYSCKLARLLLNLKGDPEKARNVLIEALKKDPNSPYLHRCLLETEISRDAVDDVMHCVERALNSNIRDPVKQIMSERRLEFLEDCGNNIKSLLNAFDEHHTLLKKQEELKRKANDEDKKKQKDKQAKILSDKPSVEKIPIPGVPPPAIPSVAAPPSVSSTETTAVNAPVSTEHVQPQPDPTSRGWVPRPRLTVRPYDRRPFLAPQMPPFFTGPVPPPRMPFTPYMPPPPYMGGPPGPFHPHDYRPWFQHVGGYNYPYAWDSNSFYPPY